MLVILQPFMEMLINLNRIYCMGCKNNMDAIVCTEILYIVYGLNYVWSELHGLKEMYGLNCVC